MAPSRSVHVATAGWSIPRDVTGAFPPGASALARYAGRLGAAEINSTFWRRHLPATFERWARTVPARFRFSVKLPRAITHEAELAGARGALEAFFADVAPLGAKLGVVLVQLPPGLTFEGRRAGAFLRTLRDLYEGPVAWEPRHASWFGPQAERLLVAHEVARVAADPPRPAGAAAEPGGAPSLVYLRLHGSPRVYYSAYGEARVAEIAARIRAAAARSTVWCVYDNTASGAAAADALRTIQAHTPGGASGREALERGGEPLAPGGASGRKAHGP